MTNDREMLVPIELTPFDALEILVFLEEMQSHFSEDLRFTAMKETIERYRAEVTKKIRFDQIEDARAEREVNRLLNKTP